MSLLKMLFLLVATVVLLIVILQNTEMVTLQILFWPVSMSIIVLVPLVLLIGFVAGFALGKWKRPRHPKAKPSSQRPR